MIIIPPWLLNRAEFGAIKWFDFITVIHKIYSVKFVFTRGVTFSVTI